MIIAIPGGETQLFCDAVATTSTPQASTAIGTPPALETASTKMSASDSSCMTVHSSFRGLETPVELSLCVNITALIWGFFLMFSRTASRSAALPSSKLSLSTSAPYASAISANLSPKTPIIIDKTLSPGEIVFTTAASIAPVPEAVMK